MSAESRATLIVEAKTDGAEAALGKLGSKAQQTGKDAKGMGNEFGGAVQSLTGFNVASLAGIGAVTGLLGVMKSSIDKTMQWTDEIDRLSRATGTSAAETSLMVTAFGAAGISVATLESSFRVLTKNGLQPNMETFKRLAVEYQAIEDPVKRNEFAMKNLGRSAKEMTEILSKTPGELDQLAQAAAHSGKVIDEAMIAKSEKLAIQTQQLQDKLDGLQIMIGGPLVDTLSKAATGFDNWLKLYGIIAVAADQFTGVISDQEAAAKAAAVAAGDYTAAWHDVPPIIDTMTDAHDRAAASIQTNVEGSAALATQTEILNSVWMNYSPTVSDAAVKNMEFKQTLEPLTGAVSDLQFGMGELNTSTIFHEAIQNLDADAALALGVSLGLVDEKTLAVKDSLDAAREKYDENRDGLISAAEAANGYSDAVLMLTGNLQAAVAANQQLNALANGAGATAGGGVVNGGGGGYADGTGGWLAVPPGYPNDSYPVRVQSGEEFAVRQKGESWGGGGSVTININGAGDPMAVAREVKRQLDNAGRTADRRMRT